MLSGAHYARWRIKRFEEKAIYRILVALMLIVSVLAGCSSSNNATQTRTELRNCIATLEPIFKLERTTIYNQLRSAIDRGQANPQDPTVTRDLATISGEINGADQSIQATTCSNGGFDYLKTVQGISSGMRGAVGSYSQGITNQDPAQIRQAALQLSQITALLKHAADITTQNK